MPLNPQGIYTLHYTFHSTIENFSACCNTLRDIKLAASQADRLRSACLLAKRLGKKKTFEQDTKTKDEGAGHTTERSSK